MAHAAKAIAQSRGWNHHRHDLLRDVVSQIAEEMGRPDLLTLFSSASIMHQNFYEHELRHYEVQVGINDARALIRELDAIRDAPAAAFHPPDGGSSQADAEVDPRPRSVGRGHKQPAPGQARAARRAVESP